MVGTLITSVISFISTNIDDIFLLMLLYARITGKKEEWLILMGRYIGTGILLLISFLGAFGLQSVPGKYLSLLGLVPIALGIKAWIDYRKEKKTEEGSEKGGVGQSESVQILTVTLITISSGADNIGVYIPLFAGYGLAEVIVVIAVFGVMTAVWSLLGKKLADLPLIRQKIQQYKDAAVAVIFIILGVYILFG